MTVETLPGLSIRLAEPGDLPEIVALPGADDPHWHEDRWSPERAEQYRAGLSRILNSPDNSCHVAVLKGEVVGVFIVTMLPGILGFGRFSAQLRGVAVRHDLRGRGIGSAMIDHAEALARDQGASSLGMLSHPARVEAHRFYEFKGYAPVNGFIKTIGLTTSD